MPAFLPSLVSCFVCSTDFHRYGLLDFLVSFDLFSLINFSCFHISYVIGIFDSCLQELTFFILFLTDASQLDISILFSSSFSNSFKIFHPRLREHLKSRYF